MSHSIGDLSTKLFGIEIISVNKQMSGYVQSIKKSVLTSPFLGQSCK